MTAGGVAAVAILDYVLSRDARKDPVALGGMVWIARNFSVQENVGPTEVEEGKPNAHLHYYLAALERMSMLLGVERIGGRDWYQEGARVLLEKQEEDGSWLQSEPGCATWDTCFAILFLSRSTRKLQDVSGTTRTPPGQRK
jgi:hypothetical protein